MSIYHKMSQIHEADIAEAMGGGVNRGSGNQWRAQMDGRVSRMHRMFAFAWDCKATLLKSVAVSRKMWEKAVEQAQGERPAVPIRFYDDESLKTYQDLIVLKFADFSEMLERANQESPMLVLCYGYEDTSPIAGGASIKPIPRTGAFVIEDNGRHIRRVHRVDLGRDEHLGVPFQDYSAFTPVRPPALFELRLDDELVRGPAVVVTQYGAIYRLVSPGEALGVTHV